MCQSLAAGGQRCACAAEAAYDRAARHLTRARASGNPVAIAHAEERLTDRAVTLASTPQGHARITQWADEAAQVADHATEARLRNAAHRGQSLRAVNAATGAAARAHAAGVTTSTPRTTRLLDRMLAAPSRESQTYAWSVLSRTPLAEWTAADRVRLATHLRDVPADFPTQLSLWKQLRDHGRAHPEERAALGGPLGRYRLREEARLYPRRVAQPSRA